MDILLIDRVIHEPSYPEMSIHQKFISNMIICKRLHDSWHEATDNYEIADTDPETFYRYGSIEEKRRTWICDLREREK